MTKENIQKLLPLVKKIKTINEEIEFLKSERDSLIDYIKNQESIKCHLRIVR